MTVFDPTDSCPGHRMDAGAADSEAEYLGKADKVLKGAEGRVQGPAAVVAPQMCCSAWLRARMPLRQVGGVGCWVGWLVG